MDDLCKTLNSMNAGTLFISFTSNPSTKHRAWYMQALTKMCGVNGRINNDFKIMNPRSEKTALRGYSIDNTKTMLVYSLENGKNKEFGY